MKPDFEKKLKEKELVGAVAALYPIGHYYKVSLIELLESAYLSGRKAQIEIDCEIALSWSDKPTVNKSEVIAKAIKNQSRKILSESDRKEQGL